MTIPRRPALGLLSTLILLSGFCVTALAADQPAESDLTKAEKAVQEASQAGAPLYAATLYNEASNKLRFAKEAADSKKKDVREEGRMNALEAQYAARAAEAKARWVTNNLEAKNLQSDITGFGGSSEPIQLTEEPPLQIDRGKDSRARVAYAQSVWQKAADAGAKAAAPQDMQRAADWLKTAQTITRNNAQNDSAGYLAYAAEMLARRATYLAHATSVEQVLPALRLERTRLAQLASEAQAAKERADREKAEKEAADLRAKLEQEQQNRQAQQAQLAALRAQVEQNEQRVRQQLDQDRAARVAADQRLQQLQQQYENAVANATDAAQIESLRRQVEDQNLATEQAAQRERMSEQAVADQIDRMRQQLSQERGAGVTTGDAAAQREAQIQNEAAQLQQMRNDREAADRARADARRTHEQNVLTAQKARESREAEQEKLRQQIAETQAQLQKAQEELAARKAAEEAQKQKMQEMQDALSKIAETRKDQRGLIVTLPGIFFDSGKSTIKPGARNSLEKIATQLQGVDNVHILIEGHTDSVGSDDMNLRLSQDRADAVRDFLAGRGISPEQMSTVGKGESEPVASNDTDAGRQQNRRVELVITNPQQPQ
ncbi:MAG: OmpA family protein [Thermoanaerobaculia bacterium]